MDIQITADTIGQETTFEEGAHRIIDLMFALERMPEFSTGWYSSSEFRLSRDNISEFIASEKLQLGSDAEQSGFFFLVSATRDLKESRGINRPAFLMNAHFGVADILTPYIQISVHESLASIEFCKRVMKTLFDWDTIQHVGICDAYYSFEDSPLDARRRGIGWAGWVPFSLTPEQVPEAVVLDPLEGGTFIACQNRWITADWESIQRAQALEVRLNSLGVLPTFDDLAKGDWGNKAK